MVHELFEIDQALFSTPEARAAHQAGLLRAKTEALKTAGRLVFAGRPLVIGVLLVSFVHLWQQIASIKPAGVDALVLSAMVHHWSSGLFTGAVDAVALYLVAARSAALFAGKRGGSHAVWFFYILTALLNGIFVISNSPNMPAQFIDALPKLNAAVAILLALLVPVSIAAIEGALQTAEAARLKLLVETTMLARLVASQAARTEATATKPTTSIGSASNDRQRAAQPATADDTPAALPDLAPAQDWRQPAEVSYSWPRPAAPAEQPTEGSFQPARVVTGLTEKLPAGRTAAPAPEPIEVPSQPAIEPVRAAGEATADEPLVINGERILRPDEEGYAPWKDRAQAPLTDERGALNFDEVIRRGAVFLDEYKKDAGRQVDEIVRLRDEEAMNWPEIAKRMGGDTTVDSVRKRYGRRKGTVK